MFQAKIHLLVCSMVLAMGPIMSEAFIQTPQRPSSINAQKLQCQARDPSFVGACTFQNILPNGDFRCDDLICARTLSTGVYEPVSSGPPLDYTRCAENKICLHGRCEPVRPEDVPIQVGPNLQHLCRSRSQLLNAGRAQSRNPNQGGSNQRGRTTATVSPIVPTQKRRRL